MVFFNYETPNVAGGRVLTPGTTNTPPRSTSNPQRTMTTAEVPIPTLTTQGFPDEYTLAFINLQPNVNDQLVNANMKKVSITKCTPDTTTTDRVPRDTEMMIFKELIISEKHT